MFKRFAGTLSLMVLVALALTGCFRQAGPGIEPTFDDTVPTLPPFPSPTVEDMTPFVTPFVPGAGPDTTQMPTLVGPSPTLSLVLPGETEEVAATDAGAGVLPLASPTPLVTGTIPFAAGPTFTPLPGAPPVDLNPVVPATPTTAAQGGETSGGGSSAGLNPGDDCTYVVQAGDTAFHIATIHGITLAELSEANGLSDADILYEGQVLQIPGCGEGVTPEGGSETGGQGPTTAPPLLNTPSSAGGTLIHVVQPGENLFRIALQYGVTVDDIVAANNLGSAEAILNIGQELVIPTP